MLRRRSPVVLLIAMACLAGTQAIVDIAGAGLVSQSFSAIGTVAEDHAAFSNSTPVDGEVDSFILDPVTPGGPSSANYLAPDGSLQIYVTPSTGYYLKDSTGVYHRGQYDTTVVEGAEVRVVGERYTYDDGTARFVARFVYNPPPPPPSGSGPAPYDVECGSANNYRYHGWNLGATILKKGIHYPCLAGSASQPMGIQLYNFTDAPTYIVSQAIEDFGGKLEVTLQPTTKYISGRRASTAEEVLKAGANVRVFGNYLRLENAWIFTAKSVWAPDPEDSSPEASPRRVDQYADSISQDPTAPGHYSGVVNRGQSAFLNGTFDADIAWSPSDDGGWFASGTWTMTSFNGKDVLRGTLTGQTAGISGFDMTLSVDSGEGQFFGVTGGGDFEGSSAFNLGGPPSNFGGHFIITVVPNP